VELTVFEIISIGNELLNGRTLNTNAHWLSSRITSLGGFVRRITVVRDELEEISSAVKEALNRGSDWIITSGGLGPTFDDLTLEGVAKALGLELELNEEALKMIAERYREMEREGALKAELTPHRLKMATLPRGSSPLRNPVGTAPGVLIRVNGSYVVCLPGVPSEMKAIFDEELAPLIESKIKRAFRAFRRARLVGVAESDLAPLIDEVRKRFGVYIKSHPVGRYEGKCRLELDVYAHRPDEEEARRLVDGALEALKEALSGKAERFELE